MNKAITFALTASIGLLLALLCRGMDVPTAPPTPIPTSRPTTRPIALGGRLAEVQFQSIPLDSAIDQLRDLTHANIVVDWRQLAAVGVEPTTRVRVRLWDVTLAQALRIVLDDVEEDLSFQEQDGVITVSTRESLAIHGIMRIYDIRPLIDSIPRSIAGPPPTRNDVVDGIVQLIETTIDPDSWKDNGGDKSLRELFGLLVITQTPSGQRRVEDLLEELQSGQGPHVVKLKQLTARPGQ